MSMTSKCRELIEAMESGWNLEERDWYRDKKLRHYLVRELPSGSPSYPVAQAVIKEAVARSLIRRNGCHYDLTESAITALSAQEGVSGG